MIVDKFNTEIYQPSMTRKVFSMLVTDIFHYETVDNESHSLNSSGFEPFEDREKTGDDIDFIGSPGKNIKHSKSIKGIRTDYQGTSLSNVLVPVKHSGHVPLLNIGDYAVVTITDDPTKPFYSGAVHSKNTNWADAIKRFERPVPPSLEMRGSTGEVMTYNPVYITYHQNYEPTERYFGTKEEKIWYDRFVLFESSDIYRNKKNFVDYNRSWIKDVFENKRSGSETILKLVEDPNDLEYMDRFFYLRDGNYPVRPDPVFDTYSVHHQENNNSAVLSTIDGVSFNFQDISTANLDNYPITYRHLDLTEEKLSKTAFDEVINDTLGQIRAIAKLRNAEFLRDNIAFQIAETDQPGEENFIPDLKNKDVPFEFKESREIRIGRNKLVIADVYGDDTKLFTTLKTSKDQGLTFFYDKEASEVSQVRLRGNLGESLLIESKSGDFSRINLKGYSGQINEMYDNKNEENYLYMLTSDASELSSNWTLGKASYFMAANKALPKDFKRIQNNPVLKHYDSRASSTGRYNVAGIYDTVHHAYNALLLDPGKQAYTENWTQYNPGTWVHDVRRALTGDAQGFYRAEKGGKYVQTTYSADKLRWQIHNFVDANIEMWNKDIIIASGSGGTSKLWAPEGEVDIRGETKTVIGSKNTITLFAPKVNIGSESGKKVARDGDPVNLSGVTVSIPNGFGGFLVGTLTGTGIIQASGGPIQISFGQPLSGDVQKEFNLEGGGI